jgi:hypothetical protein
MMTPEFYRRQAIRCRQVAAERPGTLCARYLIEQADTHDMAAGLLIELNKINAALPRPAVLRPGVSFTRRRDLH